MEDNIYYFHSKEIVLKEGNKPFRSTLAGKYDEDGNLTIAISVCSEKDIFTRKQGRVKAKGRLKSNHGGKFVIDKVQVVLNEKIGPAKFFCDVCADIVMKRNKTQLLRFFDLNKKVA